MACLSITGWCAECYDDDGAVGVARIDHSSNAAELTDVFNWLYEANLQLWYGTCT